MKNQIFSFLLGIFITISLAATIPNDILTIKPATPKHSIIVSSWSTQELQTNVKPYLKNGYVLKNISAGDGCRIVIMEKY